MKKLNMENTDDICHLLVEQATTDAELVMKIEQQKETTALLHTKINVGKQMIEHLMMINKDQAEIINNQTNVVNSQAALIEKQREEIVETRDLIAKFTQEFNTYRQIFSMHLDKIVKQYAVCINKLEQHQTTRQSSNKTKQRTDTLIEVQQHFDAFASERETTLEFEQIFDDSLLSKDDEMKNTSEMFNNETDIEEIDLSNQLHSSSTKKTKFNEETKFDEESFNTELDKLIPHPILRRNIPGDNQLVRFFDTFACKEILLSPRINDITSLFGRHVGSTSRSGKLFKVNYILQSLNTRRMSGEKFNVIMKLAIESNTFIINEGKCHEFYCDLITTAIMSNNATFWIMEIAKLARCDYDHEFMHYMRAKKLTHADRRIVSTLVSTFGSKNFVWGNRVHNTKELIDCDSPEINKLLILIEVAPKLMNASFTRQQRDKLIKKCDAFIRLTENARCCRTSIAMNFRRHLILTR